MIENSLPAAIYSAKQILVHFELKRAILVIAI